MSQDQKENTNALFLNKGNDNNLFFRKKDGTIIELPDNYETFKLLSFKLESETLQVGESIYNINEINDFNIFIQFTPKKYLSGSIPVVASMDVIGRKIELQDLVSLMNKSEKGVLISGLGGIGKTTMLRYYLTLCKDEFDHILYVELLSDRNHFNSNFIGAIANNQLLFNNLNVIFNSEQKEVYRFNRIMSELENLPGKNLLVIDNAGRELEKVISKLPSKPSWYIIVSSRQPIEGLEVYNLNTLSTNKARELFLHYVGNVNEAGLVELLNFIGNHTLTIELLAKTLKKSITIKSVEELFDMLRKRQLYDDKLAKKISVHHANNNQITIYSHLLTTFSLADLKSLEVWMLKQISCLPPEPIKGNLIVELLRSSLGDEEMLADALISLNEKGWLQATSERTFKMHRMVKEVIIYKEKVSVEDSIELIESILSFLDYNQGKDDPVDKFKWLSYGEELIDLFGQSENNKIAILKNKLARMYNYTGSYNKAIKLLNEALIIHEKNFGKESSEVAETLSDLGYFNREIGSYEEACKQHEKALLIDEKNFPENHDVLAKRMNNFALSLSDVGSKEDAINLMKRALEVYKLNYGGNHPTVALAMTNLGHFYQDLEKNKLALELHKAALEIDIKRFSHKHYRVAQSKANLAGVYIDLNKNKEAVDLLTEAISSDEKSFGKDHAIVANRKSFLGLAYKNLDLYEEAVNVTKQALSIQLKSFGKDHPKLARTLYNLGIIYFGQEKLEEAKKYVNRSYKILKKSLGIDHFFTQKVKNTFDEITNTIEKNKK